MAEKATLGICWFQPEQWQQAKELFADSDTFGDSYDDWCKTTMDAINQLQAVGAIPIKQNIDLIELRNWCFGKGMAVNVKTCSQYIAEVMKANK